MKVNSFFALNKLKIYTLVIINLIYFLALIRKHLSVNPILTPDTDLYFQFNLLESVRMPGIVLPYILIQNYILISIFQLILQTCAMAFLTVAIALTNKNLYLVVLKIYAIFVITTNMFTTRWINVIQSESISISVTMLLIGSLILIFNFPESKSIYYLTFVSIILFSSVKQGNALIGFFIFLLVNYIFRRTTFTGKGLLLFVCSLTHIYLILLSFSVNNISNYNLIALIGYRVLTNSSWKLWFESRGLPDNFLDTMRQPDTSNLNINGALADGNISDWISNFGMSSYFEFALTHPNYLFAAPLFPNILGPEHGFGSGLIWNNLLLENQVWGDHLKYIVILTVLVTCLLIIYINPRIYIQIPQIKAELFMIAISIFWSYIVWQLAPGDYTRTQYPSGLMLAIVSTFLIADVIFIFQKNFLKVQAFNNI